MSREQRLVFGEVAEDYARERPSYPDALVDDVVALAGGRDALEVGAGTGKATAAFVARPGGLLALFWNRASDASGELRRALDAIYERLAPELAGGSSGGGAAHAAAIGTSGLFGPVEERTYRWSDRRSAASYVQLLGTHSAVCGAAACRGGRTACWVGGEVGSGRGAVVPNDRYTAIWDRFPTQQPFAEPA